MSERCRYSGLAVMSCKVSDLCDCFDYPGADTRAAEVIAERDARFAAPRQAEPTDQPEEA